MGHGHRLQCSPEKYWAFPSKLKLYTRSDFFICVVAKVVTLKKGASLIVEFIVLGYFEDYRLLDSGWNLQGGHSAQGGGLLGQMSNLETPSRAWRFRQATDMHCR
jgi:hypothetical protein